ncbi:MAG: cysteine--tRNA ligase [Sandaracinaceae bacterium]|nr:cysteine--tRNA ligase [Sandaracinaceae bacterium]
MPAPFRLYNTLSREVEAFTPAEPGKVKLYFCGMTVYDHCHVGHARAMVTSDMVARYLRHRGWDVDFVRNYTDVDDKIIRRAAENGEAWNELAERYIQSTQEDFRALGLAKPTSEPRVSTSMDTILEMIGTLVERGHAYENEGSVWFDVASFPEYGKLSRQKVEDMRQPDEAVPGKKTPVDFALWKAAKPGEPSWESPWGPGRPGWHIECSAMAQATLGTQVDIHGGGLDLVFPHHENEIAQSECAHGGELYARYWMHNGLLTMASGAKMGKSEGNAFGIKEVLQVFPAEALRIYYLQVHYRSPLPWNVDALPDALGLLSRLYEAKENASQMEGTEAIPAVIAGLGKDAERVVELASSFPEKLYAAMDDDLNTAKALGMAFELARAVNRLSNHKKAKKRGGPIAKLALDAFDVLAEALGLLQLSGEAFVEEVKDKRLPPLGLTREGVEEKLAARVAAREAKEWDRADAIRAELEEAGIQVMDRPDRVEWRIRLDVREEA